METINQQKQAGMPQQPGMPGAMPGADPAAAMEMPPEPQAQAMPTDAPGSEDVQEKVNSQLDEIVSKMERMHGDIVRYHKELENGWVEIPKSVELKQVEPLVEPSEQPDESHLFDQYKKFFEEILV
jgi:hypothetical protein